MNYLNLVAQIKNYANRKDDDFTQAIDSFISLGEERIWRELKGVEFEKKILNGNFLAKNAYVLKPPYWNQTISFIYGSTGSALTEANTLYLRTYEFCRAYWPNTVKYEITSPPLFYAEHNQYLLSPDGVGGSSTASFFISPTPALAYKYELTYLSRVESITINKTMNILTRNYPDLLFYASFIEALTYLKDDERVQVFEAQYGRALQNAQTKMTDRYFDRTSKRDTD